MRTLAAWQRGDKFYLSAFVGEKTLGEQALVKFKGGKIVVEKIQGRTPYKEFNSRAELEAEIHRRNERIPGTTVDKRKAVEVVWEHLEPEAENG